MDYSTDIRNAHFTAARVAARRALAAATNELTMAARAATGAWMRGGQEPTVGRLAAAQQAVVSAQDALHEANRGLSR